MIGAAVKKSIIGLAVLALMASTANAAPITGSMSLGGSVIYVPFGPQPPGEASIIDFLPLLGGVGVEFAALGGTGYFGALDGGSAVVTADLTNDAALAAGGFGVYAPPGVLGTPVVLLAGFADPDYAGLAFVLTEVVIQSGFPTCTGGEGLGQSCVTGQVFNLQQTAEGLRINFDVRGFFYNVNTGDIGQYKGAYATTFTGLTFNSAYALLAAGTPLTCENTGCGVTATFTPVPEPATLLTFGAGTALLAARRRRAAKKASKA